jgi:hypothetical protein
VEVKRPTTGALRPWGRTTIGRRTAVGVAARERKKERGGEGSLTTRQPLDEGTGGGDEAAEEIEAAAELRAAKDLRCGDWCRSEEDGVGARGECKGGNSETLGVLL